MIQPRGNNETPNGSVTWRPDQTRCRCCSPAWFRAAWDMLALLTTLQSVSATPGQPPSPPMLPPASPPQPPSPPLPSSPPAPPPHPPCLPDWHLIPGTPCLGPAPPSYPPVAANDFATIMSLGIGALVALICVCGVFIGTVVVTLKFREEARQRKALLRRKSLRVVEGFTGFAGMGTSGAGAGAGKLAGCLSLSKAQTENPGRPLSTLQGRLAAATASAPSSSEIIQSV